MMTKQEVQTFIKSTDNQDFFRELMVDICDTIIQDSEPKESEMDTIIRTLFNQIKEGGN